MRPAGKRGLDASRLEARYATLTLREREVLAAVASGKLNKQVAADLGIVEQTVKFHRARIMEKLRAKSVAELMLIAARLELDAHDVSARTGTASIVDGKAKPAQS